MAAPARRPTKRRMRLRTGLRVLTFILAIGAGSGAASLTLARADEQLVYWPLVTDGTEYRRIPYPKEAGIVSWARSIRLDRGQSMAVSDMFELQKESEAISQSLMTPCEVSLAKAGQLRFSYPDAKANVVVAYEPPQLEVEIETIELKDKKLREMWGPCLRRIVLKAHAPMQRDTWTVRISKAD